MAENLINKVVYGNRVLIDLTGDTISEQDVLNSKKFHKPDGSIATGTSTYDVDSSGATATEAEVISGKTYAKGGSIHTGSMPNRGKQTGTITTRDQTVTIQQGYHDGSGNVGIDSTEKAKIKPENIKSGVVILGQTGTYTGSELIKATTGSATPAISAQTVLPSDVGDFDYFTQFTVAAIPYSETINPSGGYTATIAGVA